jgi:serine/threonine-protein kinase
MDRFFDRAFAREVDERFESARAMCEALAAIAGGRDATPWLEAPQQPAEAVEGRAEPTLTASVPSHEERSVSELTGSRAIEAVTTGLRSATVRRTALRRALPWIAAIAGVGVASFFIGRAWTTNDATPAVSATAASAAETPATATVDAPATTPEQSSESVPAASSSARATGVAPRPVRPSGPAVPASRPQQKPRIDPFTGLPIGK